MAKSIYWNKICQLYAKNKMWELFFVGTWFHFRTYLYFETITGFQLDVAEYILVLRQLQEFVSMSIFKHLRTFVTNQDFMIRWNINKIENINKLFFYNLKIIKIITALRTQNIYIICSYNIDLTRNAGNCLFKMVGNKSSIFSNLTDKIWKLRL